MENVIKPSKYSLEKVGRVPTASERKAEFAFLVGSSYSGVPKKENGSSSSFCNSHSIAHSDHFLPYVGRVLGA